MATYEMSGVLGRSMNKVLGEFGRELVEALASKYNFEAECALRDLGLNSGIKIKKRETEKIKASWIVPTVVLPWCEKPMTSPEGQGEFCQGLRLNHGLHSQCTMKAGHGKDGMYCQTCTKQAEKSASGIPTYGTVAMRLESGVLDYISPKDKKRTLPYANVMEKLGISREKAESEAAKFGLTIPEEHFQKRELKRGRPAAVKSVADSDDEDATTTKRKAGRPKKSKKVIESSVSDDLISSLLHKAAVGGYRDPQPVASVQVQESPKKESPKKEKKKEFTPAVVDSPPSSPKVSTQVKAEENSKPKRVMSDEQKAKMKAAREEAAKKKKEALASGMTLEEYRAKVKEEKKAKAKAKKSATVTVSVVAPPVEIEVEEETFNFSEMPKKAEPEPEPEPEPEQLEEEVIVEDNSFNQETDDEDDDEEEEEEVEVKSWTCPKGKTYLRDFKENTLYDPEDQEPVGIWNETTQSIDDLPDVSSDEESDDED